MLVTFKTPANLAAHFTVWEADQPGGASARLYVANGTLLLSWGDALVASGGPAVLANQVIAAAAVCQAAGNDCVLI